MNIILIGFMGCGKTTIGMELSKEKDMVFVDTDILIQRKLSLSIDDIFNYYGQHFFRLVEKEVISEISKLQNGVISVGGGAFIDKKNIEILKDTGIVIFLKGRINTILRKIKEDGRPLLKGQNLTNTIALYESRLPYYKKADLEICIDGLTPDKIVKEIISNIKI